jgi:pimeloyl-ACP methyl ester carboxylesterase
VDALEALTSYDIRDRLEEIQCPTGVLWGADDILVPVEDADEFSNLIPDCRTAVLDDTGHLPMLERPRSFNHCLDAFLGDEDGGGRFVAPS